MKIGANIKVDVSKLDKTRFYKGAKGTYADLTAFIDTEQTGQYGDNGTVSQTTSKEERQNGVKLPICGNVKVFWKEEAEPEYPEPDYSQDGVVEDDSQIPF